MKRYEVTVTLGGEIEADDADHAREVVRDELRDLNVVEIDLLEIGEVADD